MPRDRRGLAVLAWVLLCSGWVQLFFFFDWEEGRARFFLLMGLALSALGGAYLFRRTRGPLELPQIERVLLLAVVVAHLGINAYVGLTSLRIARESEMGGIHARALALLLQGVNPYSEKSVFDPARYRTLMASDDLERCTGLSFAEADVRMSRFWASWDARDMAPLLPPIRETSDCDGARSERTALGLKYGPAILLSYAPLALPFGVRGIYATHLLLLGLLVWIVWRWERRGSGSPHGLAAVPLFIILVPNIVRFDALRHSDCDLFPTLLAVLSVLALLEDREGWGGAALGISIAAKLLPGALLVPLFLAQGRWRGLGIAAAVSAVLFAPFALWDANGLWTQLVAFNLKRPPDSTALAYYLTPQMRPILPIILVLGLLGLSFWRGRRRDRLSTLAYVVGALLLFFATGKVFHNNYLIWLVPFLGLFVAEAIRSPPSPGQPFLPDRTASSQRLSGSP